MIDFNITEEKKDTSLIDSYLDNLNIDFSDHQVIDFTVLSKNDEYAIVDYGSGTDGFILLKNESNDVSINLSIGETYEGIILEMNNPYYGTIISISELERRSNFRTLYDSIDSQEYAFEGKVIDLVEDAGYIVDISGFRTFMPGSLASMNLLPDFNSLLGETIPVLVVNYTKENNALIVSHKDYLKKLVPMKIEKLNVGDECVGNVTGISNYGIFVEFDECLTGMIHSSNFDNETKEKYNSKKIKPGDEINFRIMNIFSNNRIVLTQNEFVDPWETVKEDFKIKQTYQGKVISIKKYGAFIELSPGIIGLKVKGYSDLSVGDKVDVDIKSIDAKSRKIYFY